MISSPFIMLWYRTVFLAAALVLIAATSEACQVPVFRYALERWPADSWEIRVSEEVTDLEQLSGQANVSIVKDSELAEGEVKIFRPGKTLKPVWQGKASPEMIKSMIDSPARSKLAEKIMSGDSVVWIFLRGSDDEVNTSVREKLQSGIRIAKENIQIPEGVVTPDMISSESFSGDPDDVLRSDIPLKIDFSILEISRDDPAEAFLLTMLLSMEDDLHEFADSPMVFPAFGRGRFLEPLIGKGINSDTILEYSAYLCGACSCEVKNQNPGMDLILATNWLLADSASVVTATKAAEPKPETVKFEGSDKVQANAVSIGRFWKPGIAVILLVIATLLLRRRSGEKN